jgi:putative transcriptional regulator
MKIHEVLDDFPEFDAPVYWGGSQHLDSVYFLHTRSDLENSREIAKGIYWGGSYDQLKLWIETKQIGPNEIRFMAGYEAWHPRKLAKEIKMQNWWVTDADHQSAFLEPPAVAWGNILQRIGHVYGIMNDFPEDPGIN